MPSRGGEESRDSITPQEYRARQSERSFQEAVIEYAELHGWRVAHFADSRRDVGGGVLVGDVRASGAPDLILARDGVFLLAELKSERGRIRPNQRPWLAAGVHLWRPRDWASIETRLA